MSRFRVYYGNGQVSREFATVDAAVRERSLCDGNGAMRIQSYLGGGEWRSLSDSQLLASVARVSGGVGGVSPA